MHNRHHVEKSHASVRRLEAGEAHLYALLPYRVKALEVSEAPGNSTPGKHFALKVVVEDSAKPGTHVMHVEVEDASGRDRPEYTQNLEVEHGAGTFRLPLALSDPTGEWKLKVQDVATGVVRQTGFQHRP